MPRFTVRLPSFLSVLSLSSLLLLVSGCQSLMPGGEPGPEIGPDITGVVAGPISLLDENQLQVILDIEQSTVSVGDTFSWYAKFDNPIQKPLTVKVYADAAGELLRFDQQGSISDPLLGSNILRTRAGIRTRPSSETNIRGALVIEPQRPQVYEGTGKVVQGKGTQILLQFADCEVVLGGPGTYQVYIPVRVDWFKKYAVGRRYNIREEARSNVETITVK